MCECEYSDVQVIGYVRVEMCECEWRCASSTFVPVTSFHPCCIWGWGNRGSGSQHVLVPGTNQP